MYVCVFVCVCVVNHKEGFTRVENVYLIYS